ncbi:MAG: hypothetical protein WDW36_006033 [Sanguina aurantia]
MANMQKQERGLHFTLEGNAFYRHESAQGRDLAVLLAAVYRRRTGHLNVLDVMAGSGVRGARYVQQAGADMVWCNDGNKALHTALVHNLCSAASVPLPTSSATDAPASVQSGQPQPPPAHTESQESHLTTAKDDDTSPGNLTREQADAWDMAAAHVAPSGLRGLVWEWEAPPQQQQQQQQQPLQVSAPEQEAGQVGTSGEQHGSQQQSPVGAAPSSSSASHGRIPSATSDGASSSTGSGGGSDGGQITRVRVSHLDANRVLASCYLEQDWYDLIDIDSFGSDSSTVSAAIDAVRFDGGMLYLTSTDGFTSGGHRPERSLASYGAFLRAVPWSNEQGLRMLIGNAVQVAAARGVSLTPLFSLYSFHGPVFRVMMRAEKSPAWPAKHYGFAGHCHMHGSSSAVPWTGLSSAVCTCLTTNKRKGGVAPTQSSGSGGGSCSTEGNSSSSSSSGSSSGSHSDGSRDATAAQHTASDSSHGSGSNHSSGSSSGSADDGSEQGSEPAILGREAGAGRSPTPLVLTGPMWTGPLHDATAIQEMTDEATARGWLGLDLGVAATGARGSRKHSQVLEPDPLQVARPPCCADRGSEVDAERVRGGRPTATPTLACAAHRASVKPLGALLEIMLEECDPRLPPGFVMVGDVSRQLARAPSRDLLVAALARRGFATARCHLEAMAFRTDASMGDILTAAVEELRISQAGPPFNQSDILKTHMASPDTSA